MLFISYKMFYRALRALTLLLPLCFASFASSALTPPGEKLPCLNKRFTIVAHIVKDSLGQPGVTEQAILEGIDTLNNYFKPICVSFEVCEFRYIDNFQFDTIDNVGNSEWDDMHTLYGQKNRINMYFIAAIKLEPGVAGFASLGGINNVNSSNICILKGSVPVPSKTITHEMGHFFGLSHTWEGSGIELVDGSNCSVVGDGLCDTPADPFFLGPPMETWVVDCRFIGMMQDANGEFYNPDVGNIMSYYPGGCRCHFTHDQYMKMATTYNPNSGTW